MNPTLPGTLIDRSFRERIVLVGVVFPGNLPEDVDAALDELALLVDTAGADVVARVLQRRDHPDPATFVGKGKARELGELSAAVDADTVVFDEELTPAQQRNLQAMLGRTAIDRTAVILDIFAQNARSPEGKAQVELALLRYRLPRLRGRGTSLSQQAGGIGTRGPGETQLEVDRRRLVRRMHRLEADLRAVDRTRGVQRRSRARGRHRELALVGYTNAGKSTLLNRLTDAGVPAEDRLFVTLDPRTRQLALPGGETVLVTDTVGFVRKLPHQLVEAFRSTLDSVRLSDLVVHVVDGSAPDPRDRWRPFVTYWPRSMRATSPSSSWSTSPTSPPRPGVWPRRSKAPCASRRAPATASTNSCGRSGTASGCRTGWWRSASPGPEATCWRRCTERARWSISRQASTAPPCRWYWTRRGGPASVSTWWPHPDGLPESRRVTTQRSVDGAGARTLAP